MSMSNPSGEPDELEMGGGGIFADINITPLTDIFLVLLIIFMVTTTAMAEAERSSEGGLEVSLPKAGKSASVVPVEDLAVAVLADGRLVVRGKVVTDAELEAILAATQAKAPGTMVLVQADAGVAHGRVVAVMDLARKKGLERLAIATQQPPE